MQASRTIFPNLSGIVYESIVDGPGVRTAIFLSGCNHNCAGCHNPETHNPNFGFQLVEEDIIQIADNIVKSPYISGITLTGGDPLFWPQNTLNLLKYLLFYIIKKDNNWVQERKSPIWIYTGYIYENINKDDNDMDDVLHMANVLVDGPFIQKLADRTLAFRGSSNQRIIDLRETRKNREVVLWQP